MTGMPSMNAVGGATAGKGVPATVQAPVDQAIKAQRTSQDQQKGLLTRLLDTLRSPAGQNRALPGTPRTTK